MLLKYIPFILLVYLPKTSFAQAINPSGKHDALEEYKQSQNKKYIGKNFGKFAVTNGQFSDLSNASINHKTVFVNFWFEKCSPCIAEIEGLNRLYDSLKGNPDFLFASFTFEDETTIQTLKSRFNIKYNVFHLDRPECYRLNLNSGFPSSFILDKNGIIQFYKIGGQIEKEKATDEIMTEVYPKIIEFLKL